MKQHHYRNRVLAGLPITELNRLKRHLTPLVLKQRDPLLDGNASHAYFLEDGLASVVVTLKDGGTVEVGIIGIDGVVGLPILLGSTTTPGRTFIQIAGSGYRIPAEVLKRGV